MNNIKTGYEDHFIKTCITTPLFGALMSMGISYSGMSSISKSFGFFVPNLFSNEFDPTLGIVFSIALGINIVGVLYAQRILRKPVFASEFSFPQSSLIDRQLVCGSLIFAFGWQLCGYCPGPAMIAAIYGKMNGMLACTGMIFAYICYFFYHHLVGKDRHIGEKEISSVVYSFPLYAIVLFWGLYHSHQSLPHQVRDFSVSEGVIGGAMIGTAVILYQLINGKILGLSGIIKSSISPHTHKSDRILSALFILGFFCGALAMKSLYGEAITYDIAYGPIRSFVGGVLVGVGTALSNGCTSGHGLCGVSRFSVRSIISTSIFFLSSFLFAKWISGLIT